MLSIVLVNYHSEDLLEQCLESFDQDAISDLEIIVIDNGGDEIAGQRFVPRYPNIKCFTMPYNAGFARANNKGISESHGDAVLLLNPDTVIINDAVSKCYNRLMQSEYVACGVQLLNTDGSPQISGNFAVTGGLNYLMLVPYVGRLVRWLAKGIGAKPSNLPEATKSVQEVDWINGAFLMVKRSAIEKAGRFDEDFFLYHEESEWCSRLKKFGKLCIFGDLHVTHLEGQSANKTFQSGSTGYSTLSDKKGYQLMLSMFVRIRKEFGFGWYLLHHLFYTLNIPVIFLLGLFEIISTPSARDLIMKRNIGFAANCVKCWKFFPHIAWDTTFFYKVV